MTLQEIKEKADSLIGSKVTCHLLGNNSILKEEYIVKENRLYEEKNICITYFENTSFCTNSLTIFSSNLYDDIIKEDE